MRGGVWYGKDFYCRGDYVTEPNDPDNPGLFGVRLVIDGDVIVKVLKDSECANDSLRVIRGGSWLHDGNYCLASFRYWNNPTTRYRNLGFRLAISGDQPVKVLKDVESEEGSSRVSRGGGWSSSAENCRAAVRDFRDDPSSNYSNLGLRLALSGSHPMHISSPDDLTAISLALPADWCLASRALADYYEDIKDLDTASVIRLTRSMTLDLSEADYPDRQERELLLRRYNAAGVYMPLPTLSYIHNGIEFHYRMIPPGYFWLGPPDARKRVLISKAFWMGITHVTQSQWQAVMGDNPSYFNGVKDDTDYGVDLSRPVESVNWHRCTNLAAKLTEITGLEHKLPSEARWEHACRACTTSLYHFGDDSKDLGKYAWYEANSNRRTQPVGKLLPNSWGLYDIVGDVWQWTADGYQRNFWDEQWENAKEEVIVDPESLIESSAAIQTGGDCCDVDGLLVFGEIQIDSGKHYAARTDGVRLIINPANAIDNQLVISRGKSFNSSESFDLPSWPDNKSFRRHVTGVRLIVNPISLHGTEKIIRGASMYHSLHESHTSRTMIPPIHNFAAVGIRLCL